MSDFITTTQDAYRNACIATFVTLDQRRQGLAERVKERPAARPPPSTWASCCSSPRSSPLVVTRASARTIKDTIGEQITDDRQGAKPD